VADIVSSTADCSSATKSRLPGAARARNGSASSTGGLHRTSSPARRGLRTDSQSASQQRSGGCGFAAGSHNLHFRRQSGRTTAGKAVLDFIAENRLPENTETAGASLREGLLRLQEKHAWIGDVRGMGLLQAIELVEDRQTKAPAAAFTNRLMEAARDQRLLIGKGGMFGNVIRLSPPMNISRDDVDEFIRRSTRPGERCLMPPRTNAVRILDNLGIRTSFGNMRWIRTTSRRKRSRQRSGFRRSRCSRPGRSRRPHGRPAGRNSGNTELDFKALAHATGDRRTEMVPLKEVQPLTGYIRGGVTALACKKDYPVWIDETAELFDVISVSAGMRGLQIVLAPGDYIRAVNASVAGIAKDKPVSG